VDVRVHQVVAAPQLRVEVDRTRAAQIGMTQREVANNLLISLASSSDAAPNFWLNPQNGVSYRVSVQTPQYRIDSMDALTSEPMVAAGVPVPELLTNLAQVERGTTLSVANHYNIQNVFDVYANVQDRDLGGAARDVRRVMASMEKDLPRGTSLVLRGQVQNMDGEFVNASVESVTLAAAAAAAKMPPDFRVSITNAPGKGVYPISSFTWLLLYENPKDKAQAKTILDFLKWALADGQKFAPDLGYAPLPASVVQLEMAALAKIKVS